MHTVRSASRAGRLSRSAAEAARTVSMCSSRHVRMIRTAISPRLAISTRRMGTRSARPAHAHKCLAIFRECPVGDQNLSYGTAHSGTHGVHKLHDLDDGNDRLLL